jgi:anti-sigma factor RsiW
MARACDSFQILLSAHADGELGARERAQVELHLSGCPDCRARLSDLRALSATVGALMARQAEEADFSRFADEVLRRIRPERPGLLERLRVTWSEILTYHRTAVFSSLATAAVTLAVAVPLAWRLAGSTGASAEVVLRELKLDDPGVQPVVLKTDDGKTLIMLVNRREPGEGEAVPLDVTKKPPTGGDL